MIKRTLKFTLFSAALAVGVVAFADVTLNNGTEVTWDNFVAALNGDNTATVPKDDPLRSALNRAQTAYNTANSNLQTKTDAYNTAKAAYDALTDDKKSELQGLITTAESTLKQCQSDSTGLAKDTASYNQQIRDLKKNINTANQAISAAEAKIETYEGQLDVLAKIMIETTDTVTWLRTACRNADAFEYAFDEKTDGSAQIYYRYTIEEDDMSGGEDVKMYISFTSKPDNYQGPIYQSGLRALFAKANPDSGTSAGPLNGKTVNTVYVYLGPDYAKTVSTGSEVLKASSYANSNANIVAAAASAVRTLATQSKYLVKTYEPKQPVEYQDKSAATKIQNNIAAQQAIITQNQRAISGWHSTSEGWKEGDTEVTGYEEEIKTIENDELKTAENNLTTLINGDLKKAWSNYSTAVNNYKEQVTDVETNYTTSEKEMHDAEDAVITAKTTLETAKTNLNNAHNNAITEYYSDVTLTTTVNATTPITASRYEGTIHGNGHIININIPETSSQKSLFKVYAGHLSNSAINGTLASSTAGGIFDRVAVNTGTAYRYYNEDGVQTTTNIKSLGQLGFLAREYFGADITGKKLTTLSDDTKVYDVTVYTPQNNQQYYSNLQNGKFTNALDIDANTFVYSATDDFGSIDNVFVGETGSYTCASVKITDGQDFYCPKDLTATKLSYTRTFKAGYNTVCLPFELTTDVDNGFRAFTYDSEINGKFYFNQQVTVPANTPALIYTTKDLTYKDLSGVTIKATDNQLIKGSNVNPDAIGYSYGNFKRVTLDEYLGNTNNTKIFGMQGGQFKQAVNGSNPNNPTTFPAFRLVLVSESPDAQTEGAAPRSIVLLDARGLDITGEVTGEVSGVENVNEVSGLNIVGGQGVIEFTSDADFGKVYVYNMNGGVVTVADVVAGTTSVSVEKGIYIVNGKKVMVK